MTPYVVQLVAEGQGPVCSCPDHRTRKTVCKHILFTLLRVLNLSPFELEGGLHRDTVQSAAENQLNFLMDEEPDLASTSGLHHRKPAAAKEKRSPVQLCFACRESRAGIESSGDSLEIHSVWKEGADLLRG